MRHPNIVLYLGMCRDHEFGLPVLLMELLDESLTHFLKNSPDPLPYHLEVNFFHDVTLALDYLHFHEIIHRDLSSNNILLIAGSRAKVTDFGLSKLLDTHITSQTQCPGTMSYMPPKALRTPPKYNKKLDCFSLGVLSIQMMTRLFPDPGPARKMVEDLRYPTGEVEVPVLEQERRKRHIDLISPNHPRLSATLRCLEYHERNRPSAQELCDRLATLKEGPQYTQSVQVAKDKGRATAIADKAAGNEQIAELQRSLAIRNRSIQQLQAQLQGKEEALAAKQEEILHLQQNNQQGCLLVDEKSRVIDERERQLRELNHQLQTNEQITAEFQENLLQKERRIQDLKESILAKEESLQLLQEQLKSTQVSSCSPGDIILKWEECQNAPGRCSSEYGSVAVDGGVVYVCDVFSLYAYNSQQDNWENLPDCPQAYASLAVVRGLLTAVGGRVLTECTNTLVSLTNNTNRRKWLQHFPPMPSKREFLTVIYS